MAAQTHLHNFPAIATSFHGRSAEITQVVHMIGQPDCRLLTLAGMGGIGKTRLAIEAARRLHLSPTNAWRDGVYWVPLASASDGDALLTAIANLLNVPLGKRQPLLQTLQNFLRDKQILLLLDNFEQLSNVAPLLSELLQAAPQLRLLATSRERLNLYEEWVLEVDGLPLPDEKVSLHASAAVQLFVQRARRRNLAFSLDEQCEGVRRICALVEGMPLAIELATAWTQTMRCAEIADAIAANVGNLTSDLQNVAHRHRSIEAVFLHSWALLTADERQTLAQLSIFRGGFSADAAQTITHCTRRTLATLVEKSLVQRSEGRLELHALIGQLAAQRVTDYAALATRHQQYFLDWLAAREEAVLSGHDPVVTAAVSAETANLRLAWQTAGRQGDGETLAAAAYSLIALWLGRGMTQEGLALSQQAADVVGNGLGFGRMRLAEATFANQLGDSEQAIAVLTAAVAQFEQLNSPVDLGKALSQLAYVRSTRNEYDEARTAADRAIAVLSETDDARALGNAFTQRFVVETYTGERQRATTFIDRALKLLSGKRERLGTLNRFATHLIGGGEYTQAIDVLLESAETARQLNATDQLASSLVNLAVAYLRCQQLDAAYQAATDALALFKQHGERYGMATCHNNLGNVARLQQRYQTAQAHFDEAMQHYAASNNQLGLALVAYGRGSVLMEQMADGALAEFDRAFTILRAANFTEAIPTMLPRMGRCLLLGGEVAAAARLVGGLEDMVIEEYAREEWVELRTALQQRLPTVELEQLMEQGRGLGIADLTQMARLIT